MNCVQNIKIFKIKLFIIKIRDIMFKNKFLILFLVLISVDINTMGIASDYSSDLCDSDTEESSVLLDAAGSGDLQNIERLLMTLRFSKRTLNQAAQSTFMHGYYNILPIFLCNGADIDAPADENDCTMLSLAAKYRPSKELVDYLLYLHADPNAVSEFGKTPLMHALENKMTPNKSLGAIKALIDGKADLSRLNYAQQRALEIACQTEVYPDIIEMLQLAEASEVQALGDRTNTL